MSLWSDYLKEREGSEVIEEEFGFIEFKLNPPFCVIESIFVRPDVRLKGLGKSLADQAAERGRAAGCDKLWSQVWVGAFNCTEALKANLAYGFKVIKAEGGCIIMAKDIGGLDG